MAAHGKSSEVNMPKQCSFKDCERYQDTKGFCNKHYKRFFKHGDANVVLVNFGTGNTAEERFWSRVALTADIDRCWEWQAGKFNTGYGQVAVNGKAVPAHRAAWFYTKGFWPTLILLHACDNRACVNPNHLREGTHQDNSDDKFSRGREVFAKGEDHGNSKLTVNAVRKIRELYAKGGKSQRELEDQFGVGHGVVSKIIKRRAWKHI